VNSADAEAMALVAEHAFDPAAVGSYAAAGAEAGAGAGAGPGEWAALWEDATAGVRACGKMAGAYTRSCQSST
jgi:hypothetical protein